MNCHGRLLMVACQVSLWLSGINQGRLHSYYCWMHQYTMVIDICYFGIIADNMSYSMRLELCLFIMMLDQAIGLQSNYAS